MNAGFINRETAHPIVLLTMASLRPAERELFALDSEAERRLRQEIEKHAAPNERRRMAHELASFAAFIYVYRSCEQLARQIFVLAAYAARGLVDGTSAQIDDLRRDFEERRGACASLLAQDGATRKEAPIPGTRWWQLR